MKLLRLLPAAALLVSGAASALSISGVSIVKNAGNTADATGGSSAISTTVQTLSSGPVSFGTRYAANGAADVGAFGSATTRNLSADYTITFSVTATLGNTYTINVGTRLTGGLGVLDDAAGLAGAGSVSVSNVSNVRTGGGTLTGSLGLTSAATQGGTSNTGGVQTNVNSLGSGVITAVGTGSAQVYTLRFTFTASATSPGGISGGDEAGYRFGANGFSDSGAILANTTIDNYPGPAAITRTQANDGHFVNVTVVPEPGTLLLLSLGLGGIALAGRARAH